MTETPKKESSRKIAPEKSTHHDTATLPHSVEQALASVTPELRDAVTREITKALAPLTSELHQVETTITTTRKRILLFLEKIGKLVAIPAAAFLISQAPADEEIPAEKETPTQAAPRHVPATPDTDIRASMPLPDSSASAATPDVAPVDVETRGYPTIPPIIDIEHIHKDLTRDDLRTFYYSVPPQIIKEIKVLIGLKNQPETPPTVPYVPQGRSKGGFENPVPYSPQTSSEQSTVEIYPEIMQQSGPEALRLIMHESAHCADMFTSASLTDTQRVQLINRLLDTLRQDESASELVRTFSVDQQILAQADGHDLLIKFRQNTVSPAEAAIVNQLREQFAEMMVLFLYDDELPTSLLTIANYYMAAIGQKNWDRQQNADQLALLTSSIKDRHEVAGIE